MFFPAFPDSEAEQRARLLLMILLILILATCLSTLTILLVGGFNLTLLLIGSGVLVSQVALLGLLQFGYVTPIALGLIIMLGLATMLGAGVPAFANLRGASNVYGMSNALMVLLAAFLVHWWLAPPIAFFLLIGPQVVQLLGFPTLGTGPLEALPLLTFSVVVSIVARSLQRALKDAHQREAVAQSAATQTAARNSELETKLHDTRTLFEQERALRASISQRTVPVQEVDERVLFAPLSGQIDDLRGQHITDIVLQKLHDSRAHTIIIDVQGISTIDTGVARLLDQLIQAIQLLGAQVMLTGISARMAATITELGIAFRNVALYPSVSSALRATTVPQSRRSLYTSNR